MELSKETTLRLLSIQMEGMKNVIKGEIFFPEYKSFLKGDFEMKEGTIGIYGQNGSGKTALIDSLFLLKSLVYGSSLNDSLFFENLVNIEKKAARIHYLFRLDDKNLHLLVDYSIQLRREETSPRISLEQETMKASHFQMESHQFEDMDIIRFTATNENNYSKENLNEVIDFLVEKKTRYQDGRSVLFDLDLMEKYKRVININPDLLLLNRFFVIKLRKSLFCYNTTNDALSAMGLQTALGEPCLSKEKNDYVYGTFPINARESFEIEKSSLPLYDNLLKQINLVVSSFVPGFDAKYIQLGSTHLSKDGKKEMITLEMVRIIDEKKGIYIPISAESNGVEKFINLASAILFCFNDSSCILAVDELDSGVFEDLMEQFLDIMSSQGNGQLIFTSHNLSAFEVLPVKCIFTTTINPKHRYIQLAHVKPTNNFRNFYLNALKVGGQKEQIVNRTQSSSIARALRLGESILREFSTN